MTYSLFVDTTSFDLLILKYAAVLQDPLHAPSEQPRFSLEILDGEGSLIDAQCGAANFIANRSLGWNEAANNVLWKDWTTVGVDMGRYAGETVYIRLTTRDCGEGSHFGYAYFTLDCMKKNMRSDLCGDVDSNRFYAPAGFAYRWYSNQDTVTTISSEGSIKVATDDITYYCNCSFVDNASCNFTISAYAGTRYPLARADYDVEIRDCKFYVTFNNNSTISADGINPLGTNEPCESALWNYGNGMVSTAYHGSAVYDLPGTYNVVLVSSIANNSCSDTLEIPLTLEMPQVQMTLEGDTGLCFGGVATLTLHNSMWREWSNGSTDSTLVVSLSSTTTYSCIASDSNGCRDTMVHTVVVGLPSSDTVVETVVENSLPHSFNGRLYTDTGEDTIHLTNRVGCDSTIYYSLTVYRNVATTSDSTVCESMLPLVWNDSLFTHEETKQTLLLTSHGADSLRQLFGGDSGRPHCAGIER